MHQSRNSHRYTSVGPRGHQEPFCERVTHNRGEDRMSAKHSIKAGVLFSLLCKTTFYNQEALVLQAML